jgi:hypothetical protein
MPEDVLGVISVVRIYECRAWGLVKLTISFSNFAHSPSLKKVEVHSWGSSGSFWAYCSFQKVMKYVRIRVAQGVDVTSIDAAIPSRKLCRNDMRGVR